MSKNIIEIALKAGFINTSNGLESPFIEGEDLTDNLRLFASLLLAQPEQEPVAWKVVDRTTGAFMFSRVKPMKRHYQYDKVVPLYESPPKREPLSDDEIGKLCKDHFKVANLTSFVRAIEKAHGITGVDDE